MSFVLVEILELPEIIEYLESRNLLKQYKKAKNYILSGKFTTVQLRKKEPKSLNIWYFRINQQYRAIGYIEQNIFYIIAVDDHQ